MEAAQTLGHWHGVVGEVGQAVVDEHRLEDHGGAPEDLHIDPDQDSDQLEKKALDRGILPGVGDRVQNAADQADDTADHRGRQGQDQRVPDAAEIAAAVPKLPW